MTDTVSVDPSVAGSVYGAELRMDTQPIPGAHAPENELHRKRWVSPELLYS